MAAQRQCQDVAQNLLLASVSIVLLQYQSSDVTQGAINYRINFEFW